MARFKLVDVDREKAGEAFEAESAAGNVYVLPHPSSLPVERLMQFDLTRPMQAVAAILGDQIDDFLAEPEMDGWALEQLLVAYCEHYGLPVDLGEGAASPRSSSATARRSRPTSRSSSATRKR